LSSKYKDSSKKEREDISKLFAQREGAATDIDGTYSFRLQPINEVDRKNEIFVLIHGVGHYSFAWRHLEALLVGEGYTVVVYDLIGRGHSSYASSGEFGLKAHTDQLRALLVSPIHSPSCVEYEKIHLLGHSQGGAVAMGFAALYGDEPAFHGKLHTLTLLAPAGLMSSGQLDMLQGSGCVQGLMKNVMMNKAAQRAAWTRDYIDKKLAKQNQRYLEAMHANPQKSKLVTEAIWQVLRQFPMTSTRNMEMAKRLAKHVQTTCLCVGLIWGDLDETTPYADSATFHEIFAEKVLNGEELTKPITGSKGSYQARTVKGVGHELTHEGYEEVFQHVLEFQGLWNAATAATAATAADAPAVNAVDVGVGVGDEKR
jgi:pimeloyl-ACP methyl ester carboxylesterase